MIQQIPRKRHRGISFLFSVTIHIALFALVLGGAGALYHHRSSKTSRLSTTTPPVIVQALAVDQAAVEQQIQAIKTDQAQKRAAQLAYQQHLKAVANQAKAESAAAAAKLQVASAQLARVQALQAQASQKLADLEQARQQLATQTSAVQNQLKTTEAQLAAETSVLKQQQLKAELQKEKAQEQAIEQQEMANEMDKYKTLILDKVGKEWILPPGVDPSLNAQFQVRVDTAGNVLSVVLVQSSGNALLDRSATTAIWKASPLPVPTNPWLFKSFQNLTINAKPEGLLVGGN